MAPARRGGSFSSSPLDAVYRKDSNRSNMHSMAAWSETERANSLLTGRIGTGVSGLRASMISSEVGDN